MLVQLWHEAEWNELESERKFQLRFLKKYSRVHLSKPCLLTAQKNDGMRKIVEKNCQRKYHVQKFYD